MLLDNTQLIRGVGVKTPVTQLKQMYRVRGLMGYSPEELTDAHAPGSLYTTATPVATRRGLAGAAEELTDAMMPPEIYANATPLATNRRGLGRLGDVNPDPSATSVMTAINSEIGWLVNLARAQQGKPPLPDQAGAPSVRVGVDFSSLKPLVPFAATGAILWLIFRRR